MLTPSPETLQFQLNQDHADLLSAFNAHGAKYLVVGGYAVSAHSQPRATKDLDIFILCSEANSEAVFQALASFGAPLAGYQPSDFNDRHSYFQMGQPPLRVDILQVISGLAFEDAWQDRQEATVNGEFKVPVISAAKLIQNKLASGRPQDLLDVDEIRRTRLLLQRFNDKGGPA